MNNKIILYKKYVIAMFYDIRTQANLLIVKELITISNWASIKH